MITNGKTVITGILLAGVLTTGVGQTDSAAETLGARDSKQPSAQAVYECPKIDDRITIDGRLDEDVWRRAPAMPFVGITDGSKPPFLTEARMAWDDRYLYVGYTFDEPDVRAYWAMEEVNCPAPLVDEVTRLTRPQGRSDQTSAWDYAECAIMRVDRFAKLFLDPDGDGLNYVEFQCNPLNTIFDAWYKQGYSETGSRDRYPSVEWKCPGLLSATRIDGTVNAPHDVDRGWTLEMAVPWTALAAFTKGACPPAPGDVWGAHLGRVYRDRVGGPNEYWVWPLLGVVDCHLPNRYGKLIFKDDTRHFERLFATGLSKENDRTTQRLVQMGVTDLWVGALPSTGTVARYVAAGINVYPTVTLSPGGWDKLHSGVPPPLQKMTDAEMAAKSLLNGTTSAHRSSARQAGEADEPREWAVSEKQKKAMEVMSRSNGRLQFGYQWGGEVEGKHFGRGANTEVLTYDILCFNVPEVKALAKDRIKAALAIPGVKGVAFDGIGYQNYYACFCPVCEALFKDYCRTEKMDPEKDGTRTGFSLKCLVDFNNDLVDYVRSLKNDAITVNHLWPVFMPEPLYGNRLKMDFCGQTAAWYQYWDPWRIEKYSRIISGDQEKYWKGVKGMAFIGYYDNPQFPVKTPAKFESELQAILRGGSTHLLICGIGDVLKNEDVCEVLDRLCGRKGLSGERGR